MTNPKHIALWSCPRSCSSLIARSFEQHQDCVVYEEPFYPPYLLTHGLDHPCREEIITHLETDYRKVITKITGFLPYNASFSFQKHIAKNILPEFGLDWLGKLNNVFLIREPALIISSYIKVLGYADEHSIGMKSLWRIFSEEQRIRGQPPLVIDAKDILKNPHKILNKLCDALNIPRDENMFHWPVGKNGSSLTMASPGLANLDNPFQSKLFESNGFMPYHEQEVVLEEKYQHLAIESREIYEKLYALRLH